MEIKVTNVSTFETLFIGDPEDWLEINDYDTVLVEALNKLDRLRYGESVTYINDDNELIIVEKDILF